MARRGLAATLLALLVDRADAGVVVEAGVPFTAEELTAALAVRGGGGDVTVRAVSATTVELRTPAGGQRVELGEARGTAAARLVALQVAPGAQLELPMPGLRPTSPRWWIGGAAGGGLGPGANDLRLATVRAHATRASGRWRLGGAAAWLHGLARSTSGARAVTAELGVVRVQAGLAAGPLEVLAGPELIAYGIDRETRTTIGVGASARLRLAGSGRWRLSAGLDADVPRHRVEIAHDGVPFAAIPRLALTGVLGLAWEVP